MGEVDGAVKRIDDPCRLVLNEIMAGRAFGIGFFADEVVRRVVLGYGGLDEEFDICGYLVG